MYQREENLLDQILYNYKQTPSLLISSILLIIVICVYEFDPSS